MKRLMIVLALASVMVLTACGYNEHMQKADSDFYQSQKDAKKPLFELVAAEGQTIELRGVKSLTVNDPRAGEIKQAVRDTGQGWKTLDRVLGLVGQGIGQYGTAKMVLGVADRIADSAGDRSTHSYIDQSDHSDNSTHIADSFNSDDDTSGDTISDSYNGDHIGRDVIGGDRTDNSGVIGDGNRFESPGPISDDGNDCSGSSCNPVEPDPEG
jgi:hypothetical protein